MDDQEVKRLIDDLVERQVETGLRAYLDKVRKVGYRNLTKYQK